MPQYGGYRIPCAFSDQRLPPFVMTDMWRHAGRVQLALTISNQFDDSNHTPFLQRLCEELRIAGRGIALWRLPPYGPLRSPEGNVTLGYMAHSGTNMLSAVPCRRKLRAHPSQRLRSLGAVSSDSSLLSALLSRSISGAL